MNTWGVIVVLVAAAVAVCAGVVLWRRHRRRAEIFLRFNTLAGPLLVYSVWYREGELVRVMDVDGAYQSATYVEDGREYDLVFDYFRAYDALYSARDAAGGAAPCARLLMLGGGGYAYPKHVVAHHPESAIDVVELDPTVTAIACRYFFLDRCIAEFDTEATGRLQLIEDDALHYLQTCSTTYDCILNDLFSGREPVTALATPEAAALIQARLTPGGLYLSNVISALEGPQSAFLHQVAAALHTAFAHVYVLPVAAYAQDERDNNMVIATDGTWKIPAAREL